MSYESALEPKTNDPSEVDNKNNASNEIMRPEKIENVFTLTEELFLCEAENCEGLKINKNLLPGDDMDHSTSRYPIKKAAYIGAILLDLAIFDKIQLDKPGSDIIVVKQKLKTGEPLLDLVLQHIVNTEAMSLESWIDYLVGKFWYYPSLVGYTVKDLRRHLTERLIAKGMLERFIPPQFSVQNITILESYSLTNLLLLSDGHKKIKRTFIDTWTNDVDKLDTKILALVMLLIFTNKLSDVLDLARLNSEEKKMAMKRAAALRVLFTLIPKLDPVQDMLRALCEALKKKITYYNLERLKLKSTALD